MEVKKINWFLPFFLAGYIVLSTLSAVQLRMLTAAGIAFPQWIIYILGEAITIVLALLYIFVMKISIRKDMQYKFIGMKDIIMSLLTGYLLIPMTLFLNSLTMLFSKNYLNTSVQGMMEYPYIVQIILVAVIPPLVEEFVFRGMFYGTYRKCGILKAALVSGVVFGIFHMNINQFAYAFVVGIVLAYMVEATGSIWASVCAHFAVNTYSITVVQILKLCKMYDGVINNTAVQSTDIPMTSMLLNLVMMFVIAAIFMLLAILCIKNMAKRNGTLNSIKASFKPGCKTDKDESRNEKSNGTATAEKRIITEPLIATIAACIVYMVIMEITR